MNQAWRSWLMIALIAVMFFSMYRMNPNVQKTRELTQLEFFKAVDDGKIVEPVVRHLDRDEGETYLAGEIETDELDAQGNPVKEKYRVSLVPGENEDLMNDLFNAQIKVVVKEKKSALSPFVMQLLFFVGFMLLFYWLFYRRMGGGGVLGFGKSRAKVLDGREEKKNRVSFSDVAGIDEAKEEVQEIVEFLKDPSSFQKLGGRIPKGVLLVGPPGTGKTLLARAIAGEAKVPFFAMSGSDFEEMFVGVGASRMRDVFSDAKKRAPCIVFIDEIDSIGQKRTGAGAIGGNHAYEQTLNTMLVEMDGFDANEGVIVIAATNRPDTLDGALLRPGRFDRQVVVELPTLKGREEILKLHGAKIKFAEDADLARVARGTPGFSGADLANLLNEAALLAVRKKLTGVDMATLDEARDKVIWGRERKSAGYSQKDRETTAWHEAGHALLQVLLPDTDPLHKVTIIPRGRALGATMSLPERDVLNRTKRHFLSEIRLCCGGRIAEELFTGDVSTGAAQDIAQATSIARDMICRYGMSDRFGFQAFQERSQFTGDTLPPAFSEETSKEIDAEVKAMIDAAYADAKRIITENRGKLETLAKALLERETMDGRDVEALLRGGPAEEEAAQTADGAAAGSAEPAPGKETAQ
ncbi:MAG: ATP-dependent zinc metalloprotease FtsH [Kiritimatiellae bacterium]|nr:ATP-dependent zinc metalloprotease FtsH [Kiritimatiellia bacterium]